MASTYMKLRIAFFVFSAIGLILYIAAFTIPKWSTHESGSDGLWQICYINGGSDTCALWPDYLMSANHKTVQILSCLGLSFFILFVVMSALTIFWTNHWKKAKAIKYTTVVLAILAVVFVIACLMIYKNDKSGNNTISLCWYLALVGAVIAAIVIPFYLIDACRTVDPKKSDREKIIAIPAMPASTRFPINEETDTHSQDYSTFNPKHSRRPPLLSKLRRQNTTFIHPPPKSTKGLTIKDIKSFPLPPSKTKINLFDKTEIEDHPSPAPPQMSQNSNTQNGTKKNYGAATAQSSSLGTNYSNHKQVKSVPEQHSVFNNTKTINNNGKTMLKIQSQSDSKKPPLVLMSMTDNEENCEDIDDVSQVGTQSCGKSHFSNFKSEWDEKNPKIPCSQSFSISVIKPDDESRGNNSNRLKSVLSSQEGLTIHNLLDEPYEM
ncbi:uncharacterized protein LOC127702343 [Mytilus californianus]|uniref:uncharacterized protein LOC127702343 n=1 Tax=Mytilus californianus TaxID=6549 RepID=UPI002245D2AC|nr:uncharacterized protein LOC127702343 [Mytilus californianus]